MTKIPRLCLLLCLLVLAGCNRYAGTPEPPRTAAGQLTAYGAAWQIGQADDLGFEITFTDTVYDVHQSDKGQWYLNFGAAHPESVISVWVPKSYTKPAKRDWFVSLEGQPVKVTGKARLYKGRPEIVVNNLDDIQSATVAAVTAHESPTTGVNR